MQWHDKLPLGVLGFCKQELAQPLRYQAELGNEGDVADLSPESISTVFSLARCCSAVSLTHLPADKSALVSMIADSRSRSHISSQKRQFNRRGRRGNQR